MARSPRLPEVVVSLLRTGWSPASLAGRLPLDDPQGQACRGSPEAIYRWIYAPPVATLARALISLWSGRTARRGGPPPAPRLREPRYLDQRPGQAAGRAVPEGDLVLGPGQRPAVAPLVERTCRCLVLVPRTGHAALSVGDAVTAAGEQVPAPLRRSLTGDCGGARARHATVTATTLPVYVAHPHSWWHRGSNENLHRIVRAYFPQGGEITSDPAYLARVAAEINDRPRKIYDWKKPSEVCAELIASDASAT